MKLLQDIKDNGFSEPDEDFDEIDPTSEFDLGDELL